MPEGIGFEDVVKLIASEIKLSASAGDIIMGSNAILTTPSLATEATGESRLQAQLNVAGDFALIDQSERLIIQRLEVLDGDISIQSSGDVDAVEIRLINDWRMTQSPSDESALDESMGIPNQIHINSEGELTVGLVTGGLYAENEAQAQALRMQMVNDLLGSIDLNAIDMSVLGLDPSTTLSDELLVPSLSDEGVPLIDADDQLIRVIELGLLQWQAFQRIYDGGFLHDENDLALVDARILALGLTQVFTDLDISGANPDEPMGRQSEWDHLLALTSPLQSFVKLTLEADIIQSSHSGDSKADVVGGSITLIAKTQINGLETAVREFESITTPGDVLGLKDMTAVGQINPGATIQYFNVGGHMDLVSEDALVLWGSGSAGGNIQMISERSEIFIHAPSVLSEIAFQSPGTGARAQVSEAASPSLVAGGTLSLEAASNVTIVGDIHAVGAFKAYAGNSISSLGQRVELQVGSIDLDARATVALGGDLTGLSSAQLASDTAVNLHGEMPGLRGFVVTTPGVASLNEQLKQLNQSIQSSQQYLTEIQQLESRLETLELGGNDLLNRFDAITMNQLLMAPAALQLAQVLGQVKPLLELFEAHTLLPTSIADFDEFKNIDYTRLESLRVDLEATRNLLESAQTQLMQVNDSLERLGLEELTLSLANEESQRTEVLAEIDTLKNQLSLLDKDVASLREVDELNGVINSLSSSLDVASNLNDVQAALTGV
jgi:hypothetical protein